MIFPLFKVLMDALAGFDETGMAILGGIGVFVTLISLSRAFVPHDPMAPRIAMPVSSNPASASIRTLNRGKIMSDLELRHLLHHVDAG